jgi:hypothetical protein
MIMIYGFSGFIWFDIKTGYILKRRNTKENQSTKETLIEYNINTPAIEPRNITIDNISIYLKIILKI